MLNRVIFGCPNGNGSPLTLGRVAGQSSTVQQGLVSLRLES